MEEEKSYLIAGATSGIGEACANRLAEEDTTLFLLGRNKDKLSALVDELPGRVIPICYDLSDLENIKSIFTVVSDNKKKLDGMVYSAGVDGTWPIKTNRLSAMQEMMNINCFAFVEMGKNFYSRRYSKDNSSIVAISSIASLLNEIGMASYSASKAALNSVVKTMSKEFIRRKIRVNAILPAGVNTKMAEQKAALLQGIENKTEGGAGSAREPQPLGIIPKEAIAEQAVYLLSCQSRFTTGELMTISAGRDF